MASEGKSSRWIWVAVLLFLLWLLWLRRKQATAPAAPALVPEVIAGPPVRPPVAVVDTYTPPPLAVVDTYTPPAEWTGRGSALGSPGNVSPGSVDDYALAPARLAPETIAWLNSAPYRDPVDGHEWRSGLYDAYLSLLQISPQTETSALQLRVARDQLQARLAQLPGMAAFG